MKRIIHLKLWTCIGQLGLNISNVKGQNTGPTAPEFDKFEPVDATDMVNVLTGDFVYSLPLLSVPNLGYSDHPIALSYNAGVMVDQESSWVGLGWTLNPGSIKPNIVGTPDDHARHAKVFVTTYDGKRTYYNVSAGVGLSPSVSASIGYSWGSDGYKSYSVGLSVADTYGINYSQDNSGDHSVGLKAYDVSVNLSNEGVSYNANLISSRFSVGYKGIAGMTISQSMGISYKNGKFSTSGSIGVSATVSNSLKSRNYTASGSIQGDGFTLTIPLKFAYISFSKKTRFIRQINTDYEFTYGNLYPIL